MSINALRYIRQVIRHTINEADIDMGAGFVIFRQFSDGYKLLCLIGPDGYDIPKGHIDTSDPSILSAALRELREETGITSVEMFMGQDPIAAGRLVVFIGSTQQDPILTPNAETGIVEHQMALWIDPLDVMEYFDGDIATIVGKAVSRLNNLGHGI